MRTSLTPQALTCTPPSVRTFCVNNYQVLVSLERHRSPWIPFQQPPCQSDKMAVSTVPDVVFKCRVRDDSIKPNPFKWLDVTTKDLFAGKKVIVFALPGAFTPTCSSNHLPRYEELYGEFQSLGVSDIICLSVNDAFVMYNWGLKIGSKNVKLLGDGNGEFTRKMGMLVDKSNLGFGMRTWRYSMLVDDCKITKMFAEPGFADNAGGDPFECSDADTMLAFLKGTTSAGVAQPKAFEG
uniref:Thioredoxin domain-containing protein n=1 Tax=Chromera velia CCMP2878 TaxID=1169474 RepID=A0A0G4FH16_9ALVE|eukprot:Cvel_16952.t1-p1 / transcript=Cvel_16952.t1 / gene=Cvel_16952 / organism=Chromera_velia_CCMP2878 / gene_product=Putative peroxiredoxin sll1621, putative / transcript_product=Putative peroxiredoxin sll1621, putative / location=Cvel_scaffold1330:4173-4883(+) / protein_length=237 / sequence_SO=supercontig / SO=protein_coding / is_pseudo=false